MNDLTVWVVWGIAFFAGVGAGLLAAAVHYRREADSVEDFAECRRVLAPRSVP